LRPLPQADRALTLCKRKIKIEGEYDMKKHFVTFYSPGTFVAEQTTKPIESWDVEEAVILSRDVKERYGAIPFGFRFSTRERCDDELDSRESKRSKMYYLGGTVLTLEEIKARKDPADATLISNMECNGWDRVLENRNSWRWSAPLEEGDVVLEV